MENFKDYVTVLSALLAPLLAIVTITSHILNYRLAKRRRNDDLFNRRFQFMKKFEDLYYSTGREEFGATMMNLQWDDLAPFVDEAQYLFGNDIVQHIASYENKSHPDPIKWVPDSELRRPFKKYLNFN